MNRLRILGFSLWLLVVPTLLVKAQNGPRVPSVPGNLSFLKIQPDHDDEKETDNLKNAPGLVRHGSWKSLKELKIAAGPGTQKALGEAMAHAFAEHEKFQGDLEAAKGEALFGAPKSAGTIYEFPESFVLVRSTSVVVKNPEVLAQKSSVFRGYIQDKGAANRIQISDLNLEGLNGLRDFMKTKVKDLAPNDPIRLAAEKGEEPLLKAIAGGVGPVELIDTFQIPKSAFPVIDGRLQLPFESKFLSRWETAKPDNPGETTHTDQKSTQPVEKPDLITSGKSEIHTRFMAGFTLGNDWTWKRRWNYTSGYFRITLGARYGVGLRIPIAVDGDYSPTRAIVKDTRNRAIETNLAIRARAVDGDVRFYRDAGIPENLLFDGKEAVLEARMGFGYKFRALWCDVSSRPFSYWGLDFSQNFTPPTGRDGDAPVIAIPPSLTRTEFDFGGLNGSAQFGIRLVGTGTILFDLETLAGGKTVHTQRIESKSTEVHSFKSVIPLDAKEYGFRLKNPSYRYNLDLVPTVKLSGRIHFSHFSRGISTGWIDLNQLSIDIGPVTLGRHKGTRKSIAFSGGKKEFQKIESPDYIPKASDRVYITLHNGKYLRDDKGGVLASGDHPDENALFEIRKNQTGTLTLWLKKRDYPIGAGKLSDCRVGITWHEPQNWEYFRLEHHKSTTGDSFFLIKCEQNGKYLDLKTGGLITAECTDINKAARFKFWPADTKDQPK